MSQGKRSRPGLPDPEAASKAPDVARPLWSGAMVPSGNYEYYGLRPPAAGAVQARPLPYSPGWTPPDWLLEYHGLRPTKPAEGAAPPSVQQKEAAEETAAHEEAPPNEEAAMAPPEAAAAPAVQAKLGQGAAQSEAEGVHAAAARGTSGAGASLPYLDEIQRSFGWHDVSHIKAHTGQVATEAARSMGAEAFTTGEHVAFAGTPSLHTAAHEAAHVAQQRCGVQLQDGMGQQGDPYEEHADRIADAVVRGDSVAALLNVPPGLGSGGEGIQRQVTKTSTTLPRDSKLTQDGTATTIIQGMAVTILPDKVVGDLESAGRTVYEPRYGAPGFKHDGAGKVTKINPLPSVTVTIQTLYRQGVKPEGESAYGRGTTDEDKRAGNTSLRFHEGSHGKVFLDYLAATSLPRFTGKLGMSKAEFKKAQQKYLDDMAQYFKDMDVRSGMEVDCVGAKADFCPPGEEDPDGKDQEKEKDKTHP